MSETGSVPETEPTNGTTDEEAAGAVAALEATLEAKDQEIADLRAENDELVRRVAQAERYERVAWRKLSDLTDAVTRAQGASTDG